MFCHRHFPSVGGPAHVWVHTLCHAWEKAVWSQCALVNFSFSLVSCQFGKHFKKKRLYDPPMPGQSMASPVLDQLRASSLREKLAVGFGAVFLNMMIIYIPHG